eukprot:sb/3469689/
MRIPIFLLSLALASTTHYSETIDIDDDDFSGEEEMGGGVVEEQVSPVPIKIFPYPSKHLFSSTEERFIIEEVFASSYSHKGAYKAVKGIGTTGGHVILYFYPTSFDKCLLECGIIQRIDKFGRLHTPQLYVTHTGRLKVLAYGSGLGKVMTFDRNLKLFTWHKIVLSMDDTELRVCVSTVFTSHCHIYIDKTYEFSPNGVWVLGKSFTFALDFTLGLNILTSK